MATCSAGELTRLLKPCEICLQSFGSLLGVSTQPVFSGEKNLTSEKEKKKENVHFCCYVLHQTAEKSSVF